MSDNVYIGRRCAAVSKPPALKPISKVVLWIDNQNCYEAGDSTGREIEITCPYGTQAMAEDLLRKLSGYKYQPMTADDALLDPAAELGDAVTVDDCYTVMASMELTFDGLLTGDIAAPGAVELAQEYQFSDNEKILIRKIARNRSAITKTAEEIRMEVSSLETGINGTLEKYATLETTDEKIAASVKSLEETVDGKLENYATVTITDEKIAASVKSLEETIDGKLENYATVSITDEKIAASVKSLEETVDGKLENYATVSITDEKIAASVKSLEETVDGKLENYATVSITDEKISAAVKSLEETVDGKLENYATVTIADEKISAAVKSLEETVDGKLENYATVTIADEKISAAVKSLEETVDGKLENYATVTIADEKISAAVKSLEETVDGKLENYATVTIADEKISAAVKSLEETVDGKLENYATVSIADEKISTAVSTAKTEIENGIATTLESYSTIDQTSESISAAVTGFVDGETLSSEITAALGELSLSASSANGTATLTLKDGNTELSSKSFTLNVDAVNISGTLDAHFVSLDGLLELKNGEARGYVGANNAKGGAVLASENTSVYVIANNTTAKMSSFEEHMIWVHTSGCFSTDTIQISSDRTLKDNINYDLSDEEKLFEKLQPCSFSYISDKSTKKHWGFIAQDFIASAHYLDMDTDKLAVLGEYEGKYSIGYGEITALNTYMIQKLMRRVAALESRLEE